MSLSTQLVAKGKRQFALETCKSKREGSPVEREHCSEHKQTGRNMCPHIVHRTKRVLQDNGPVSSGPKMAVLRATEHTAYAMT
jgi:hypothetical protein